MDLLEVENVVKDSLLNSNNFPYRTGRLRNNFFDVNGTVETEGGISTSILSNERVKYGKILQLAPTIRYKVHRIGKQKATYKRHENKHFRYINRIIDTDVVSAIETEFGVKRI